MSSGVAPANSHVQYRFKIPRCKVDLPALGLLPGDSGPGEAKSAWAFDLFK